MKKAGTIETNNVPIVWTVFTSTYRISFSIHNAGASHKHLVTFPDKDMFDKALTEMQVLIEDEYSYDYCIETFKLLIEGELYETD